MPLPKDVQLVADVLRKFSEPASLGAIHRAVPNIAPRTLRRHLQRLADAGFVEISGTRSGTRYVYVEDDSSLPISPEGRQILRYVRKSLTKRHPVGYDRTFLESYSPNETFYLPLSLREHLAQVAVTRSEAMVAGTYAREILGRLLIDLSWNSSRLEGNTYSLLDTERLIKAGETAEGKEAEETQMILNHKAAIELLVENAAEVGFNRYTLLNLHAILANNLLPDPAAGGRLRARDVGITGTVFHPLTSPQVIEECFDLLLGKASAIRDPFEQSFFAMVHLPYLQPFDDVNKRVSRLAANIPLIRQNLSPLSFVDVPKRDYVDAMLGVYELKRIELLRDVYTWAYERSAARYASIRQSLGEPDPFRLKYRQLLYDTVAEIVRRPMSRKSAAQFIKSQANDMVPAQDQERFVQIADGEVLSLHEGNIARYGIRPSEFTRWNQTWGSYGERPDGHEKPSDVLV
jgi:Fic family protein